MPANKDNARERSLSGDFDDSDDDSHMDRDGSHPPGKPGRKKNPNSQAARRDQNRIAQREFRLRKQQRIRDLEARVELLSGGKDEAMGEMRNILRDLMQENQTLRNLLRGLGGFIGDGAGGLLPKLGWDMTDFTNFINRSETDTAWEGYQVRKKSGTTGGSSKRPAEDDSNGRAKKARGDQDKEDSYSMLLPMAQGGPPTSNMYSQQGSNSRPQGEGGTLYSELMRGAGASPMFLQAAVPSTTPSSYPPTSSSPPSHGFAFGNGMNSVNLGTESSMAPPPAPPSFATSTNGSTPASQRTVASPEQPDDDDDPKKNEAYKLIHYHLDNYKRNTAYCLPSSLRPTLVQRTVPHESVIDRILHPDLRDRMILLRGRFDLVDCLFEYRAAVTIHGDDVLSHSNWEIAESWLRQFGFLADNKTLEITNKWRRERGEPELRLSELSPAETTPTA